MKALLSKVSIKIVAIIASIAVAAGGVTVALVKADVFTSPEAIVERSFDAIMADEVESTYESVFGWSELFQRMGTEGADVGLSFTAKEIPGELLGMYGMSIPKVGIGLQAKNDVKNKKQSGTVSLELADTKLASIQVYADEKEMQLAVPQLFTPVLSLNFGTENFEKKIGESYLSSLLGFTETEWKMIGSALKEAQKGNKDIEEDAAQLGEELEELKKDLYRKMSVKKNGKSEVAGADNAKCKNYVITLSEDTVEDFLDDGSRILMSYLEKLWNQAGMETVMEQISAYEGGLIPKDGSYWESIKKLQKDGLSELKRELEDVKISVDVKGKRVVRILVDVNPDKRDHVTVDVVFALEGRYMDNFELTVNAEKEKILTVSRSTKLESDEITSALKINADGEKIVIKSSYSKKSGDFKLSAEIDGVKSSISGTVTELKKGKALAAEINSVTVSGGLYKEAIDLELSFYLKVFDGKIEPISEDTKDVLSMSESNWSSLIMEAYGKIIGLVGGFGGLFE